MIVVCFPLFCCCSSWAVLLLLVHWYSTYPASLLPTTTTIITANTTIVPWLYLRIYSHSHFLTCLLSDCLTAIGWRVAGGATSPKTTLLASLTGVAVYTDGIPIHLKPHFWGSMHCLNKYRSLIMAGDKKLIFYIYNATALQLTSYYIYQYKYYASIITFWWYALLLFYFYHHCLLIIYICVV
jgi:hypothetical protein